jgi:hypothetical protein
MKNVLTENRFFPSTPKEMEGFTQDLIRTFFKGHQNFFPKKCSLKKRSWDGANSLFGLLVIPNLRKKNCKIRH